MIKNIAGWFGWIAVCFLASAIGSAFTYSQIPIWYASLIKSPLNPPNWVFGPVWTLLYTMMATAAFLVWQKGWKNKNVNEALKIFLAQLIFNTCWSILFFGQHALLSAFFLILSLWLLILLTTMKFFRISKAAGWLMVPYLLWVSFASYLNFAVWLLNK